MGFDQYHEPANELPAETRTFARMIASLIEEAEAINWYQQRIALEPRPVPLITTSSQTADGTATCVKTSRRISRRPMAA
ncbi:MAG: uncharacterized protein QOJ59_4390 [Thermomicrobiales bacterium]|nr:uncharacterized protein [Thermomicrobiales bacterium]